MRAVSRPWEESELAELIRAYGSDAPVVAIAAELERSPAAVKSRLYGLQRRGVGLPRRRPAAPGWTRALDERLVSGYHEGLTLQQLAGVLGRDAAAVASRVEVLRGRGVQLPPRKTRWTEERRRELARRRFVDGLPFAL